MRVLSPILLLALLLPCCNDSADENGLSEGATIDRHASAGPSNTDSTSAKPSPKQTRLGYDYTFEAQGKKFRTYISSIYGANDVWLEYSTDGKKYKKLFTGCALQPTAWSEAYTAAFADGKVVISYNRAISEAKDFQHTRFVATIAEIERDSDSDGLPDLVEYRFMTDATNTDTDGDGKKDGEDNNPLVSGKIKLSQQQEILKAGFLQYHAQSREDLVYLPPEGVVLAEFESEAHFFELPGRKGPVLAMTYEVAERFGEDSGFYVPQACFSETWNLPPKNGRRRVAFELDILLEPLHGTRCKLTLELRDGEWKLIDTERTRIY